MFEVGFTEILLILGLALLVLGPEKLPALAEKVGRWTGRARAMARQLRTQLEHEVTMEELTRSRPMQSSQPPLDSSADAPSSHSDPSHSDPSHLSTSPEDAGSEHASIEPHSAAAPESPPRAGPELDLDRAVSGVSEPSPAPAATEPENTGAPAEPAGTQDKQVAAQ